MILDTLGLVSDFCSERKSTCDKTQRVHWLSVCDVLPFKVLVICCPCSVVTVGKTLDNANFPKNVKCLQLLNSLI